MDLSGLTYGPTAQYQALDALYLFSSQLLKSTVSYVITRQDTVCITLATGTHAVFLWASGTDIIIYRWQQNTKTGVLLLNCVRTNWYKGQLAVLPQVPVLTVLLKCFPQYGTVKCLRRGVYSGNLVQEKVLLK